MFLNNMYRIRSQHLGSNVYCFHIEKKIKILFFSVWKKQNHILLTSQQQAESYLPIFIIEKENAAKVRYYLVDDNKIIAGFSEKEVVKKRKLIGFL